jgi:protein-arginine kinase activator protein McsA
MITPAGKECPYYYQDFHRGRATQECRLIDKTPDGGKYTPDLCESCTIPNIVLANACENMILEARASRGILGFGRRVNVSAYCTRSRQDVQEPQIGCGECHLNFPTFELPPD